MYRLHQVFLFITVFLSCQHGNALDVGDTVCLTGYIMDHWCIEETGGKLLDNRSVTTLQNPEKHSFHCLLDVSVCKDSGYQVLGEKDPATDRHCLGFRLAETDRVLAAGRATGQKGYCSTCSGGGPVNGYRATVKGTIQEMGDGSGEGVASTPLLSNIEMRGEDAGCGDDDYADIASLSCSAMPASGSKTTSVGFGGMVWTFAVAIMLLSS